MGTTRTYPDGSQLVSSALTLTEINGVIQPVTMGMLGYQADPASQLVRVSWPTQGAPYQDISDDICYLRCVPKDEAYNRIRDRVQLANPGFGKEPFGQDFGSVANLEQWNFTRIWTIHWCCYGPNSLDNCRAIRDALFQDYFTDLLAQSQLFTVSDFPAPVRVPELTGNGQWIERVDFECEMYEFVTETIYRPTVASVEVIVQNPKGEIADVTIL